MVIPGWRYLVSGGTTGQVFTKVSGEDGDYQWSTPSSGGTPGGSDTQIQFNNAGAFAGSANLTWDGAGIFINGHATNNAIQIVDSNSSGNAFYVNPAQFQCAFGDIDGAAHATSFFLDDASSTVFLYCSGVTRFGDVNGYVNGSKIVLDVPNSKTTSNVKHEMSNGSGTVTIQLDAATGTWTFTLPVDDGDSGDVLTTDGSGNTSWVAPSGGSGLTSPQVLSRSLGS